MSSLKDIKVVLVSHTIDPEQVVASAIRQCYSPIGAKELKESLDENTRKRLITQVLGSGHLSTLEHASFTFAVEGVSRVTEVQLVRHRIGTAFSIQSGRYVKRGEATYARPASFDDLSKELRDEIDGHFKSCNDLYVKLIDNGIKAEDARYLQPQSLQTKIVVTMNARELLHFFNVRTCKRAQWEIQAMANKMMKEVVKIAPNIFQNSGPSCMTEKVCWEGEKLSCGLWKTIDGAISKSRI